MMSKWKKTWVLLLPIALLLFGCPPKSAQKGANATEVIDPMEQFGRSFVDALKARRYEAILPLMVTQADAEESMKASGLPADQVEKEMATLKEAMGRMRDNQKASYNIYLKQTENMGMEAAAFERVEREQAPGDKPIDKTDINVFFKADGKHYMVDVDDCVHAQRGWVMTGKFQVMAAPTKSEE